MQPCTPTSEDTQTGRPIRVMAPGTPYPEDYRAIRTRQPHRCSGCPHSKEIDHSRKAVPKAPQRSSSFYDIRRTGSIHQTVSHVLPVHPDPYRVCFGSQSGNAHLYLINRQFSIVPSGTQITSVRCTAAFQLLHNDCPLRYTPRTLP